METLIPHLRGYNVTHIKRSRGVWDKTLGLLWKTANLDGDAIIHVNYALQDAWLVSKLKHLDVLHCHGSDVRTDLATKRFGWIVRGDLRRAKVVLYSTEDLYEYIEPYRKDAVFLPRPIDTEKFKPIANMLHVPLRALYFKKWYEEPPIHEFEEMATEGIRVEVHSTSEFSYEQMPAVYNGFDIFIDQHTIKEYTQCCLEAMSCGLKVITWKGDLWSGMDNREFIKENHDVQKVAEKLMAIYEALVR
jgi:hypothetical protein